MKKLTIVIDKTLKTPLYRQIYDYIKEAIFNQDIKPDEKLPSLRSLAKNLEISITTIEQAYGQLEVEGYVYSKANSGYYVKAKLDMNPNGTRQPNLQFGDDLARSPNTYYYDSECFNFERYKKCLNRVINEYQDCLNHQSTSQGELLLRQEISRYVYQSRGVRASSDQIVIGAGTQQLATLIARILTTIDTNVFVVEDPSYIPVIDTFKNSHFSTLKVPVTKDGVAIDKLPTNIPCVLYTAPSNQFPTGAFMPIDKRIEAINWAIKNKSYIIEDDYDSELRYLSKPIPAMQGLDKHSQAIIYLGSFSSTMYQSFRISYLILPNSLLDQYNRIKDQYNQTCSKLEQLALALFMHSGDYQKGIKKMRKLYAAKLETVLAILKDYDNVTLTNRTTGIALGITIRSSKSPEQIIELAKKAKIKIRQYENNQETNYLLYYNYIPKKDINKALVTFLGHI
ncbi:MAG: PLP-dependent aminotransferase family protein [Erysipelotrichaceae bacterium]|nr:PLP-dependent aminotransferase family protein [Erysipelotrichaceae bacterium]MDD3810275.1 PLP-dependent aminotransferase family protein [Erysipelotrichaceae bacterium]